jgi:hypothetical protein
MNSKRKAVKEHASWEHSTREWATDTARSLALDLYHGRPTTARPYGVGVVVDPGETVWSEVPVRFNQDWPAPEPGRSQPMPAIRPWLVTSGRVVGRLADGQLYGYRWEKMVGLRVDLSSGRETLAADIEGERPLLWSGPGLAPMAVAAVFHLYGPAALIDHPGLAALRVGGDWRSDSGPQFLGQAHLPPRSRAV